MRHRRLVRPQILIGLVVLTVAATACTGSGNTNTASGSATLDRLTPQVGTLPPRALKIMSRSNYDTAHWAARVVNMKTGKDVLSLWANDLMVMGSNMKLYTMGTALDVLGANDQITTPVYQVGGNIILVAKGDPIMGGRNASPNGPLGYSVPPQFDANGLPGAKPAPGNPLAGLNDLAKQVAAAGVTEVPGNVLVDTRLFENWTPTNSTISPIVINDNLLDVITTPGAVGQAPTFETVPKTAAFTLVNQVETVPKGKGTDISFEAGQGNQLIVTGTIEAGSSPVLNVYHVPDPATFARTLFIEALERAGVTVNADPTASNDPSALPPQSAYTPANLLGSIKSPKFRAITQLTLKISHNEIANLTVCLMAVKMGSHYCPDGFKPIRERTKKVGITPQETWFVDGAGGGDASTTAGAMTRWIDWINHQPYGKSFPQMLPILGQDGSIGMIGTHSPAKGKIQAKTGTTAALDASNGRLLMLSKALAGYMQSKDGTPYYFAIYMNGGNFKDLQGQYTVNKDLADVAIAIQQSL